MPRHTFKLEQNYPKILKTRASRRLTAHEEPKDNGTPVSLH